MQFPHPLLSLFCRLFQVVSPRVRFVPARGGGMYPSLRNTTCVLYESDRLSNALFSNGFIRRGEIQTSRIMENGAGCSNQSDERGDMMETACDQEEIPLTDSALCKRAAQVKEKFQDDTYGWAMRTLDVIIENFQEEQRAKILADLTQVVESLCLQDIEHNRSKELFDKFCRIHPLKMATPDFSYTSEFNKYLAKEGKVNKERALKHPKYLKFLESVKEKEKGKKTSQTTAISVD